MRNFVQMLLVTFFILISATSEARWLSVDPVKADTNNGQNFNRYTYANNNPYRFTDPDGRQSLDQSAKFLDLNRRHNGNLDSMNKEMSTGLGTGLALSVGAVSGTVFLERMLFGAITNPVGTGSVIADMAMGDALGGASIAGAATVGSHAIDAVENFGPFHRLGDSPGAINSIKATGELLGNPPRNFFQSDIPKVQAYSGPLPQGAQGFQFTTPVAPDVGHVPGKPTWSPGTSGVTERAGQAVIPCTVTGTGC